MRAAAAAAAAALSFALAALAASGARAEAVSARLYADNYVELWVNGRLVAKDPIVFTPHNVVETRFRASYPMTVAVLLRDFAHPRTGLEYNHTRIGDGGFVAWFSNGLVTGAHWRCLRISWGPVDRSCLGPRARSQCRTASRPIPAGWQKPGFDDGAWPKAVMHSEAAVRPLGVYYRYRWGRAKFIWSGDLEIDNTLLCRVTVRKPAG